MSKSVRLAIALCALTVLVAPRAALAVCSSGGTVSNVLDCVPGGKGSKDCFVEFSVSPEPPPDPKTGFPTAKIECLDNDPSCDNDITPGQCTFLVGHCLNVTDSRFTCTPTTGQSYELKKPSAKDALKPHKNRFDRNNRRDLDQALTALGLPVGTGNVCTPETKVVVPLKNPTTKGKGKVGIKMFNPLGDKDTDSLKLTCLPNPAIATVPCASARQIVSTSELIGGPLGMGRVGDWLLENDKVRFIVRDIGRDFSFMLTYGGHPMDADFQRKLGPAALSPPYPAGRDSFLAMTPLINISSSDNPTSISVVNSGATGGPAIIQTTGPDDLFDPIDPAVAIEGFNPALGVPPSAIDVNIDVTIMNEYRLNCGDDFLTIETFVQDDGGSGQTIYVGDYTAGGGQLEEVAPALGFGQAAVRLGAPSGTSTLNFYGWFGYGAAQGISYGLIFKTYADTSAFTQSGVAVPIYGNDVIGVLFSGIPSTFVVPPSGTNSFKRWLAVSDNGMGRVLDARHKLAAAGEITPAIATGFAQGTVTVAGQPIDGARVSFYQTTGTAPLVDVFETTNGGFYQGTLPKGNYRAAVKVPGHPYQGGGALPLETAVSIGSSTTIVDFDVPATGYVQVLATETDGITSTPISAKVSVVGLDSTPDPGTSQSAVFLNFFGNIFGYDGREKLTIYGLPTFRFAGPSGDTGVFPLQPGAYQIVVSHGPEYSVYKTAVPFNVVAGTPGSPQVVNAVVRRVVDTTGFVSSDHHVHMANSPDSDVSRTERVVTMLAEGVDYFNATDHDFLTDLTADVTALGASGLVKTSVSAEMTYFDSGHFNAWPMSVVNPLSVTGGAPDWGDATAPVGLGYPSDLSYDLSPDELGQLVKGPPYNAKVYQANHFNSGTLGYFRLHGIDTTVAPPQSSTSPANVRQDPAITNTYTDELTALELWIESSRGQNALALGENMGDWFNMLNNFGASHPLLRKAAVFDSDTHSSTIVQAGGPRTMVASATDDPALIVPGDIADNLNDGRAIGTSGPFMRVTIAGTALPDAGHELGKPLIVNGTGGAATVNVDIQSPDWAEFDQVLFYVNNVPSCTTTSPNFVGGVKKVCPPSPDFTQTPVVTPVLLPNGGTRLTASAAQPLVITEDTWVVVVVRGRDNVSKPLFPMNPQSILPRACSGDPCRACTTNANCSSVFAGTCTVNNQTITELADGNLNQCGVLSLAIANPLFIDFDGDGLFNGAAVP
jgi:hypothetical protein